MRRAIIAAIVTLCAAPASASDWYEGEYQERCADMTTTADIVECIGKLSAEWDARLNEAYKERMSLSDDGQATALRTAQRAWIAYRDANCAWYRAGGGTIAAIEANVCVFALTRDRAMELEASGEN